MKRPVLVFGGRVWLKRTCALRSSVVCVCGQGSEVKTRSEMEVENNLMTGNGGLGKISTANVDGETTRVETNTMPRNIGNRCGLIWSLNVP